MSNWANSNKWIIVLVVLVVIGAYYYGRSSKNGLEVVAPNQIQTTSSVSSANTQNNVYDYTEAPNHIGEYASIRGKVVKVYASRKGTIFFDYDYDYRNAPFSAVIFASSSYKFNNPYQYEGQTITITGLIKTYQGRAEIILNSPDQIR